MDLSFRQYQNCRLCPRRCSADRTVSFGFCGCSSQMKAARAALHMWEEPCISGTRGSGTIFFSGCTLGCCFCQNYPISQEGFGAEISPEQLAEIMLRLQDQGAHNISLVTADQYLPSILPALDQVRHRLTIPVVYNCGGYQRTEIVKALKDYVDIWLPDLKYQSETLSARYSRAADYFACASGAIAQMIRQTGAPVFDESGLLRSGVIIRHMVLPQAKEDSIALLAWMRDELPKDQFLISLMSQYTPFYRAKKGGPYPEISRRVTSYEYQKVVDAALDFGLSRGYMQQRSSAREEYTPPFDLEGIPE